MALKIPEEGRLPDFIVIGAMKCATSTLHRQLRAQKGIFMSRPKEPNFFSRDDNYSKGIAHYARLFSQAHPSDRCGEASTHYTKRPKYMNTVKRMLLHLPQHTRFIYLIRHPVDRLVSQYIHEWTDGSIRMPIDRAVARVPQLIDFSRYSMQLAPYFEAFDRSRILVVFFERLVHCPMDEFARITAFIGARDSARWRTDLPPSNVSRNRVAEVLEDRAAKPRSWTARIRDRFSPRARSLREQMARGRPRLQPQTIARLEEIFDDDLRSLGESLGFELSCRTFEERALAAPRTSAARPATQNEKGIV